MDHRPSCDQLARDALDDLGLVDDNSATVTDHRAQHEEEATPS
ncbi:hypothetical protein AB0876_31390 [Mycobacterium sp. NPDC049093]